MIRLSRTLAVLMCVFSLGICAQDLFDYSHTKKFALELYTTKNYEMAAWEFERLLSMNEDDDTVKLLLLSSYRHSGNLDAGLVRSHQMYKNISVMPANIAFEYSLILMLNNDFDTLNQFLNSSQYLSFSKKEEMSMYSCLLKKNWHDAKLHFYNFQEQSKIDSDLKEIFYELDQWKFKKPFLAASMSTVVPGSGKIYAGYWKDGLFTLGALGVSSWQAYKGFDTDGKDSVYGWIFTGLSGVIYLSNIYGSQKAAKSRNLINEANILIKVRSFISVQ